MFVGMTPQKERLLFETFPRLYANRNKHFSPMEHGMCCGDGWYEILWKLSTHLEPLVVEYEQHDADGAPCPRAVEVKERAGELLFAMAPERLVTDAMREAIADAENEAVNTCEICGKQGKYRAVRESFQTLCDTHIRETWIRR